MTLAQPAGQMEKYSLLKLRPALAQALTLPPIKTRRLLRDSLYSLLDGVADKAEGVNVTVVDGQSQRQYEVVKYERYKAGLMGRVWLHRTDTAKPSNGKTGQLVSDEDALGLKWHLTKANST